MTKTINFSIILATYNAAGTLQACLDSYAAQTWAARELIIVDGGSTDGTLEIIKANAALITRWISEPDKGIYDAWNKALTMASRDWVYFIGADDAFADNLVLEKSAQAIGDAWQGEPFAYGHVHMADESGRVYENIGAAWDIAKRSLDHEMSISHQGMFHHRGLFERHGGFDESFAIAGDYDLLLRVTRTETPLYIGALTIARRTRGGVSTESSNTWRTTMETRRAQRNSNCFKGRAKAKFTLKIVRELIFRIFGARITEWLVDLYRVKVMHRPRRFE